MDNSTISYLVGVLFLAYLSTFIIFAIVRILTGVSIQRLGFSSLRRITYSPKDGIKIEIRGFGLELHRPTFAQPTWLSIVLSELKVTVDPIALNAADGSNEDGNATGSAPPSPRQGSAAKQHPKKTPSKTWTRLEKVKDKIKRVHRIIPWIRLVDFVANKSAIVIQGAGSLHVGAFQVSVDTRLQTVDRTRLFRRSKSRSPLHRPAEWRFAVHSVLFHLEGKEATEVLDHCVLNVHGYLVEGKEGLRDSSIALKLGRLRIPCDDILKCSTLAKYELQPHVRVRRSSDASLNAISELPEDKDVAPEESDPLGLGDAKGFVSSLLRGIQEVSVAVSTIAVSKSVSFVQPAGAPIQLNMALKELGMDMYRLDPSTPAQSMYFSRKEVAHQVLLSAISIAFGVDDGHGAPEHLLYVPMTTATIKTTLPAKLLQVSATGEEADLNANVVFANVVVTSPSLDMDPRHLPLVLAIAENRPRSASKVKQKHQSVSRLLPKTSIKFSVHEPVMRVALPPVSEKQPDDFDFDLLISSISSISLEIDSSHISNEENHYSLASVLRVTSHRLYYQTKSRETHDLLLTELVELKAQASAAPHLFVVVSGHFQTLSLFLLRPEISEGLRQIVQQLRTDVKSDKLRRRRKYQAREDNFIRTLPSWLSSVQLQATDFNVEVAGVDEGLSPTARGLALHLDSWTTEYRAQKDDPTSRPTSSRRRRGSMPISPDENLQRTLSAQPKNRKESTLVDSRRLAVHLRGFEAFIIESLSQWESEPFISITRSEVALTTSNDGQGRILHVNSYVKSIYIQYSLFKHYAVGVAVQTLQRTFAKPDSLSDAKAESSGSDGHEDTLAPAANAMVAGSQGEIVAVDLRIPFVQVKATMPGDPPLMLHLCDVEAGRHRWATPFLRASDARLYSETPGVKGTWSRIVSLKTFRLDLRESRRKHGSETIMERSLDLVTDALRVGIPHELIVYEIFDNIINTAKTIQQLHHRFKTNSNEYILQKSPEGPKKVPKITLRTHVLVFEIEDSAFDWKLGVIYRTGLEEQKQRKAREDAFEMKVRRLNSGSTNRYRSRSGNRRESEHSPFDKQRGRESSERRDDLRRAESPLGGRGRRMRYETEGTHALSGSSKSTIDQARERLDRYNSQSWKKRIDASFSRVNAAMEDLRGLMWGIDELPVDEATSETILQLPRRPSLMKVLMSDLTMTIDKPSFPLAELPEFMFKVGKGLPKDTKFGLLIPLNAHFEMGEVRVALRDYPLPLLHIPAIKPGQSPRLPSWSLKTDFIIAEEFQDFESTRDLQITVVPADKMPEGRGGFAVNVRRTVSPVKTYSDIKVEINTARDTRFTWGASYQPAIQDLMQVVEGFSKPQLDPSDRLGFWDKLRLNFHSRINMAWKGDGDVHLMLKGSRDPYVVTGFGTGFVLVWRNDVTLNLWRDDEPRNFMTVDSGDCVLAIPDFNHYARRPQGHGAHTHASSSFSSHMDGQAFKKVVMKLSGRVRWQVGLVFERFLQDGTRSFEFEPHYGVVLKNPRYIKSSTSSDEPYDAFRGFRSSYIHMSISISAPSDRDWSVANLEPSANYNSVHLSPRFFTHFFAWWAMFSGVMSLPIRQGPLFPNVEKSGKKFGRHLATIKYALLLSPLFISHVYKHRDSEDPSDDKITATGLKARLNSFMLDVHQRREEFDMQLQGHMRDTRTTSMRINQAFLDLISADVRAVTAHMTGASIDAVREATAERLANYQEAPSYVDLSNFTIPDNDFSWIDVDDFVEVDWTLPADMDPETKILPLAYFPRFTYRRNTDHGDTISGDSHRSSAFGYESTHNCVMSRQNDSLQVQWYITGERLKKIEEFLEKQNRAVGEQELKVVRDVDKADALQTELDDMREHVATLQAKRRFLKNMMHNFREGMAREKSMDPESLLINQVKKSLAFNGAEIDENQDDFQGDTSIEDMENTTLLDNVSDFNNRFVVHNAQVKWNNSLRNIVLRYLHQVSQRRGFIYYTTRRAVKFILDIVDEQNKTKTNGDYPPRDSTVRSPDADDDINVQDRIEELLKDATKFVNANDPEEANASRKLDPSDETNKDVAQDFTVLNTYHLRLLAPQVQLQSETNSKAVVLVTARGMRLKVFQIMDRDRVSDEVSGLVQRRFHAEMDNMQFFVTSKQLFTNEYLHMYSGHQYGSPIGSAWPPWVPIEGMFDFHTSLYGFARVVQRTSASMRYDKYNQLRLKYNDNVTDDDKGTAQNPDSLENRMDHLWVDFPHLRAICDSSQYYTLYIIVLDLILWSEPTEKTRNERLEKIMLASDFSDLRGAPEMVVRLQERIRQLDEIKTHFHIHEKDLDRQGWQDRIAMENDLASCEDELFFMMKAITTAQRKLDDRVDTTQSTGILRWYLSASEIVWHLVKEADTPLVEFQLGNASFERTDNSDGSNHNSVEINRIYGLNLLPNAIYPEIIAPYHDQSKPAPDYEDLRMLRVNWFMLEAIAGIPVVEHFEVNLFPVKIQLEYDSGRKLFEYIFPGMGHGEEGFSPFMVRHQMPENNEDDPELQEIEARAQQRSFQSSMAQAAGSATGAGSLEQRVQPTFKLPDYKNQHNQKGLGINWGGGETSLRNKLLGSSSHNRPPLTLSKADGASDTASLFSRGRDTSKTQRRHSSNAPDTEKRTRFHSHKRTRSNSRSSRKESVKNTDDLSQMLSRASSYMTLAYVKVPSVVLSLSYKGKGNRSIQDVHNFVFRMPTLEYRNKTWSNLDLALALKKDVIRALISHTGAIIGNKFTHHKPGKLQQSRLRELATSSAVLSSNDLSSQNSATSSLRNFKMGDESPRISNVTDGTEDGPPSSSAFSGTGGTPDNVSEVESVGQELQPETSEEARQRDPIRSTLQRHISGLTHKALRKESVHVDEADDSTPRKGTLKKIFHSLDRMGSREE